MKQCSKFVSAVLALALVLSLGLTALPAFAAEEPPQRGVITYTEPIAPQYEAVLNFSDGLAAVKKDGKWGFLSASAPYEVVIPAQYERVTGFGNGFAAAYDGTNTFLIDWYGNPVPGADALDASVYFRENGYTIPGEYVIIERDGLYGIGHVEYLPDLPEETALSSWSYDEVVEAIEENLVPVDLQNLYHNDITRMELSRVMVQAVEK